MRTGHSLQSLAQLNDSGSAKRLTLLWLNQYQSLQVVYRVKASFLSRLMSPSGVKKRGTHYENSGTRYVRGRKQGNSDTHPSLLCSGRGFRRRWTFTRCLPCSAGDSPWRFPLPRPTATTRIHRYVCFTMNATTRKAVRSPSELAQFINS
jgi:hypothetical protein